MTFINLAKERYSCSSISDKPVEPEKTEQIIQAGLLAPTAVNKQPFHIWVLTKDEDIEKVKQTTRCDFGAKLFFVIGAKKEEAWVREYDQRNFADVDASIVATQMMLEIEDLGLATTWVGHFDAPKLMALFPEMNGYDLIAMFPTGYANKDAKPSPKHDVRKSAEESVTWL